MQMTLLEFQQEALKTDRLEKVDRVADARLVLFGLFGEVGSLLSALKKYRRDASSEASYRHEFREELADCLWYLAVACSRLDIQLSALGTRVAATVPCVTEGLDASQISLADIGAFARIHMATERATKEDVLIMLGATAGAVLEHFKQNETDALQDKLGLLLRLFGQASVLTDMSLEHTVEWLAQKSQSRYPEVYQHSPLFDENFPDHERLPRLLEMQFVEHTAHGKPYVIQQWRGVNIGDRLTDNAADDDGYRFHDVFHLSYAVHLGWSPVLRALLRLKRKSNARIDEVEDGARAVLIEEGVATWIFGKALQEKLYEGKDRFEYSLLKAIRDFVDGYEVEQCPLWQWERAITEGFSVFRQLKEKRSGVVVADLTNRTLTYKELSQ